MGMRVGMEIVYYQYITNVTISCENEAKGVFVVITHGVNCNNAQHLQRGLWPTLTDVG